MKPWPPPQRLMGRETGPGKGVATALRRRRVLRNLRAPVFLGPVIPISGDGRSTWDKAGLCPAGPEPECGVTGMTSFPGGA